MNAVLDVFIAIIASSFSMFNRKTLILKNHKKMMTNGYFLQASVVLYHLTNLKFTPCLFLVQFK
ncbi:hypothetical protein GARC_3482 [Paraglaciecola arctica BSs20135]|uniref:Uncharacterized protein n=1 Tax=Paraglaciecola arctica BSs20135 TaxID=493475 RepID=K6YQJ3_9ALTE|nr:hypothetical protein GARC_3482 [Paraglaciecola arctica BSs20135]